MTTPDPAMDAPEPVKPDYKCEHCGGMHSALRTYKLSVDLNVYSTIIMTYVANNLDVISQAAFADKAHQAIHDEEGFWDAEQIHLLADSMCRHGIELQKEMTMQIAAGMGTIQLEDHLDHL